MSEARLAPTVTPDTKFFWDGLGDGKLLIQHCVSCGDLRHPPRPMCPRCNSLEWDTIESSGRGTVYSFVLSPYPVALVDLEDGVRILSNLVNIDTPEIGMPVQARYVEFDGSLVLHQFGPA